MFIFVWKALGRELEEETSTVVALNKVSEVEHISCDVGDINAGETIYCASVATETNDTGIPESRVSARVSDMHLRWVAVLSALPVGLT